MKASNFETSAFGSVQKDASNGFNWFLPSPLPKDVELSDETQMALSKADGAVGRLDGVARLLRNPELISRPYAAREAVASSRIEGTQATLTDVYESEAGNPRAYVQDVRAIEAYRQALDEGLQYVRDQKVDLSLIQRVHAILVGNHSDMSPGQWRTTPVWLGSPTKGPETARFVPPIGPAMIENLDDWETWHARPPRLPLLIRIALLHYQFLTIHPFRDGNGRVGRMLIQLLLEEERALSAPLLYVSAYFAANRTEYYDRLQNVREKGEIQEWLQFFLTAVHVQAEDGLARALHLLELREKYRADLSGVRSRAPEVVDMLFENPVVTAAQVQLQLNVSNQGALNLLRSLERRHWLSTLGSFGRGGTKFWYAPQVLQLFDDESRPAPEESE
ncbi:Fic family protein [Pseudarthrobacter sulfonivorans]|nr:Fic/DOC family N-terminal domain-containing protein [Pseudarthrobacter sulfonivorans]